MPQGPRPLSGFLEAAAGGAIAAMAMTGLRVVTEQLGIVKQSPPDAIMKRGVPDVLKQVPIRHRKVAIQLAHWGYGAFGGVAYRALPDSLRDRPYAGPLYGLALWVVLETALEPMLGIHRRRLTDPGEQLAFIADHVLYGLVLSGFGGSPRPGPGPEARAV